MKQTAKENTNNETSLSDKELFLLRRKRDNQLFLYIICYIVITGFPSSPTSLLHQTLGLYKVSEEGLVACGAATAILKF